MVKRKLILLLCIINTVCVFADFWGVPKIITAYSQNNEYVLQVNPIKFPNKFFSTKYQRQLRKGIVKDSIVLSHAVLYHICHSDTTEVWNKPLVNRESPVKVIVANDGKSVITIDDWEMTGYEHTLVIYGEDGELIRDFKLEDISPFLLEQYSHFFSGISWGKNVEYLDNDRVKILFRNEKGEERIRVFNIKTREFEEP